MWAPTSEPFSRTQTVISLPLSAESWRSRMAAARPAGPAPTMTTSYCIDSRRSEEHTSELQSLMRISYAVFCLKKKKLMEEKNTTHVKYQQHTNTQDSQYEQQPTTVTTIIF